MNRIVILLSFFSFCLSANETNAQERGVSPEPQGIDLEKSEVTFAVSNLMLRKVKGTFKGMKGSLIFDPEDLFICSFNVCIDASTVDTENVKRDEHLLKEDFFAVDKYPNICFESNSVLQNEKGFVTKGILNLCGVEKEVEFPFRFDGKTFDGSLDLNRLEYGLGEKTAKALVGDKVSINIVCVLKE